jgi:hypothetical protein
MPLPSGNHTATFLGVHLQVQRFSVNAQAIPAQGPWLEAGNSSYVVHVLIINTSHRNILYDDYNFKLQSNDGQTYAREGRGWLNTLLGNGALAPGQRIAGDVVFQAPSNRNYTLLWDVQPLVPAPLLASRYHFVVPAIHISLPNLAT